MFFRQRNVPFGSLPGRQQTTPAFDFARDGSTQLGFSAKVSEVQTVYRR